MRTRSFCSRNTAVWVAIPSREPLLKVKMARIENLSGRQTLLRKAASLPRLSGRPHSRDDTHLSDLLRLRRKQIRDPNAADVEQAMRLDGRKQDSSQESQVCPRDNLAAEHASIRA